MLCGVLSKAATASSDAEKKECAREKIFLKRKKEEIFFVVCAVMFGKQSEFDDLLVVRDGARDGPK